MIMGDTCYAYHMGWEYVQYVLHLSYGTVMAMVHYRRNGRSEFLPLVVPYRLT